MRNKGITLVALVVTIIIMLILAGVTLGTILGENGLIGRTQKAVKSYDMASEMETLTLSVANYNISQDEADKLGEKLSKKDVSNPDWHMIVDEENTYSTGWYFVKQGYALPNGSNAKNNWVINYETGEVKQLKENYASMSLGDSVAVKDGLVLNIDTAMMDKKEGTWTKSKIEKALGDNVTLNNFEEQDLESTSGFNSEGFLFDGKNDYISITSNTVLDDLFNKGFTFEFSGICKESLRDFDTKNDRVQTESCALFSIKSLININSPFVISIHSNKFFIKIGGNNEVYSEWSNSTYGMNTYVPYEFKMNELVTYSLVLDLSKTGDRTNVKNKNYTGYKLSLYIDGKEELYSYLNVEQWSAFKEKYMESTDTLNIGMYHNYDASALDSYTDYGKMSLKNLRFYTRPLTAEEIKLNYDTRLAYDENN